MVRFILFPSLLAALFGTGAAVWGQSGTSAPPLTYELMIDGESYLVEANRVVKLQSRRNPEVKHEVALRIAPTQHVELNSLQFDYEWPAAVEDDQRRLRRTVRIRHEMGYTMILTDLGGPLKEGAHVEALKILRQSTEESLREAGMQEISVSEPPDHQFAGAMGRGVIIRYRDPGGYRLTCLAYLLTGDSFAATCVVQYFDLDQETVLEKIQTTLESVRPIR